MTPRKILLTCGLLTAMAGAALAGAVAGGSAVYWAVRDRLAMAPAPAQPPMTRALRGSPSTASRPGWTRAS